MLEVEVIVGVEVVVVKGVAVAVEVKAEDVEWMLFFFSGIETISLLSQCGAPS
jgi:hypothetical protein